MSDSDLTVRKEVLVAMPTRGSLMNLGQLRAMLNHESVKDLDDSYEVLINEGAFGHSLRLMERSDTQEAVLYQLTDLRLETKIEELEFSVRTANCLNREGIHTLEALIRHNPARLLRFRNFNQKSVDEIQEKLAGTGYQLLADDPPLPPHLMPPFAKDPYEGYSEPGGIA